MSELHTDKIEYFFLSIRNSYYKLINCSHFEFELFISNNKVQTFVLCINHKSGFINGEFTQYYSLH